MGTGKTLLDIQVSQDAEEKAEQVLRRLENLRGMRDVVSIPIIGSSAELLADGASRAYQFSQLRERLAQLPPFTDDAPLTNEATIALGRKLGIFPRTIDDYYVYKSSSPEQTWPGNMEYWRVIHNVLPLRGQNLPRHTYWHEIDAGITTTGLFKGIAISVNRNLGKVDTTTPIAQARNKLYTNVLFRL